jgi:NAD(P)-dependent dehydrogenase (short-subunit alcohol dehydrogenase family)
MDLAGRRAVVTGAGGGIGAATVRALSAMGAAMVLVDLRRTQALVDLHEELVAAGRRADIVVLDVTQAVAVRALFGPGAPGADVDVLVNAAGVLFGTSVSEVTEQEWDLVLDVNLKASFLMSQAALDQMSPRGWGRIVNVSSTAGKNVSTIGGVHYTAAKAGVLGLTRHMAKECAAAGITVNAVCPGLIDTAMVHTTIAPEQVERYADGFPIRRLGTAEEVGDLIAFLASPQAAYITGASVDINGGDLMV